MKKKLTILLSLYVFYITGICFAESTVMDTFWFVDNDESIKQGSMLLAPLTASSGAERPVFYASKEKNTTLYNKYFEVCKSGFDFTSDVLWPVRN